MPMQSRTDQVHSYQFFLQRMVSGLVAKESDPAELPFRRLGWSAFGSIMIAILVLAGFGVYGIVVGGGATSWRDGRSVILEKDSGTAYIYRDDRLHPMANLVSAVLALDGGGEVVRVSARSLAGVPRGPVLGIPGAPDRLPGSGDLLTGGWSVCSQAVPDGRGGRADTSVLGVGRDPRGGARLGDEQAVLVAHAGTDPDRNAAADGTGAELHLVWHGHRFALPDPEPALLALGVSRASALPVAPVWLDALPVGDPVAAPEVSGRGGPTTAFGDVRDDRGIRTGQVIEANGAYYLVRSRELREITPLQADLLLNDPDTAEAYPDGSPATTDAAGGLLANAVREPLPERAPTSAPQVRPVLAPLAPGDLADRAMCATFAPGQFTPEVWLGARLAWQGSAIATGRQTTSGGLLADQVLVEGGRAALVAAMPSPDAPGGSLQIVTDQGIRHPVPGPEVAGMLGYAPEHAVRLPAALVSRLPAGPGLEPELARQPFRIVAR